MSKKINIDSHYPLPERNYEKPLIELPFAELEVHQSFKLAFQELLDAYEERHSYQHPAIGRVEKAHDKDKCKEETLRGYFMTEKTKMKQRNMNIWNNRTFAYRYIPEAEELRCWRMS